MGYSGMDEIESMLYGNLDDDEDLEAELLALQGEDDSSSKPKPKKRGSFTINTKSFLELS